MRIVVSPWCALCLLLASLIANAQEAAQPSPFDLPRLQAAQVADNARALQLLIAGDDKAAEQVLRAAIERIPHDHNAHYNLACALARQKKTEAALAALELAIEYGFRDRKHIEADDDLKSLRDSERFRQLLAKAETPLQEAVGWKYQTKPATPDDGQIVVGQSNVAWVASEGMFRVFVNFPPLEEPLPIAVGLGESGDLLRKWDEDATAAGNYGDLYDNHDSDHSNMNYRALPRLTRVEFSEEVKGRRLHHGTQLTFLYNAPTIGNSSTALTSGPFWRSQPRLALMQPAGAARLHLQYRRNQMYFYPEHRDHDAGHNGKDGGYGDVYAANTPYMIISQGSSGSDRAFMNAVAQTMAAFRPEVKQKLVEAGLLMPAVQMIFRRCNKMVVEPDDYLIGKAHPTVFDGSQLDVVGMVTMAHGVRAEALPPLAQIQVTEEDEAVVGRDYFDMGARERVFDTPCAAARVVKSTKYMRRMVISAEASADANGHPLSYRWSVLRGDAERITINKLNDKGSVVELLIPYHERRPIAAGANMESNRVDIGAFVHNGHYYSPPAILSLYYLDNEKREYDDQQRIRVVDYTDPTVRGNYVDPALDLAKDWRDEYHYADDGTLTGWTRIRGDAREEFTAEGRLIVKADDDGTPIETVAVRYVAKREQGRAPMLVQERVE